jgi:hypothetical protein
MGQFAQVRIGKRRIFVEITKNNGDRFCGWRVNADGSRWERETKDAIQTNMVIFHRDDVVHCMKMNFHYGELERCA